jgi:hypothetical protein
MARMACKYLPDDILSHVSSSSQDMRTQQKHRNILAEGMHTHT